MVAYIVHVNFIVNYYRGTLFSHNITIFLLSTPKLLNFWIYDLPEKKKKTMKKTILNKPIHMQHRHGLRNQQQNTYKTGGHQLQISKSYTFNQMD
jgi:hypothetical protein